MYIFDTWQNKFLKNKKYNVVHRFLNFVTVPPFITGDIITNPKVVINSPVTIFCPAMGTPQPRISWMKNGEPIIIQDSNSAYRIGSEGRELMILSAQVTDTAQYRCTATNEAGSSHLDFNLQVYGKI